MTHHSAPPLLHGPYAAPACEVGGRLACKVRGPVIVAGFHQGPIPWPFARGIGRHRLIICGDLACALREESLATVAHWWGVSVSTAWAWRKALATNRPSAEPRRWTEEEDRLVLALPPGDVAHWTGRSLRAIYGRRSVLGVQRRASS